jgi:hypothetical protein
MKTKPTQGLSSSERLEDRKTISTYSLGAKSMKAQGAPTANIVAGKYIQVVRSVITAFDSVMRLIVQEEVCQDIRQPVWWIEFCFFFMITVGPVLFFEWTG